VRYERFTDQGLVWDSLAAREKGENHTSHIHYSGGILPAYADADMTIPNGAPRIWRDLRRAGFETFLEAVQRFLESLGPLLRTRGVTPQIVLVQRRYANQRARGIVDGRLVIDPRLSFKKFGKGVVPPIHYQPEWLEHVFALICNKHSNLQFQIGCRFEYGACTRLATPDATRLFVEAWVAGKAFLDEFGISVQPTEPTSRK
jgi:hypothetical protein